MEQEHHIFVVKLRETPETDDIEGQARAIGQWCQQRGIGVIDILCTAEMMLYDATDAAIEAMKREVRGACFEVEPTQDGQYEYFVERVKALPRGAPSNK